METKNIVKTIFSLPKKALMAIGVVAILVVAGGIFMLLHNDEKKVDTTYLIGMIQESSELTTAKLTYTGMSEFEDTGVGFINKSNFTMVYEATARIGIDVKEVKVKADDINKQILVSIPQASVQEVHVDTQSIKYFDEKFSLFNVDQKEDSNEAIALAEEKALTEIQEMGVLEMADTQAASLIKGILANAIPDGYTIVIEE